MAAIPLSLTCCSRAFKFMETSVFLTIIWRSFSLNSLGLSCIRISSKTFEASCVLPHLSRFSASAVLQLMWNSSNSGGAVPGDRARASREKQQILHYA